MKRDSATRDKLLQCAREEFMEKGYLKASLRNICQRAGVTTGALYFFFKDKADLFENLTKETVELIYQIMQNHFGTERILAETGQLSVEKARDHQNEYDDWKQIIEQMYLHREDILLVLTKGQGSNLEHIEEKFVKESEKHYRMMADAMEKVHPEVKLDDKLIHWLSHMQVDAFVYMITHIEKKEEAYKYMTKAVTYMVKGWCGLFDNQD